MNTSEYVTMTSKGDIHDSPDTNDSTIGGKKSPSTQSSKGGVKESSRKSNLDGNHKGKDGKISS